MTKSHTVKAIAELTEQGGLRSQLEELHDASFGWALHCCDHRVTEAEEVLQASYVKVLEGRAKYHGRSSFKTWLFAVIRQTALDERRRHWLRLGGLLRFSRLQGPGKYQPTPAEEAGRSQRQKMFRDALEKLPTRQREVLHLVFYEDVSIQEAAVTMGVSLGSARQHYERGKRRLRELMQLGEASDER